MLLPSKNKTSRCTGNSLPKPPRGRLETHLSPVNWGAASGEHATQLSAPDRHWNVCSVGLPRLQSFANTRHLVWSRFGRSAVGRSSSGNWVSKWHTKRLFTPKEKMQYWKWNVTKCTTVWCQLTGKKMQLSVNMKHLNPLTAMGNTVFYKVTKW